MINFLICLLLGTIAVEAVTEIIVDSKLFYGFRAWLLPKSFDDNSLFRRAMNSLRLFLFNLLNCGYCSSVWVSAVMTYLTLDMYSLDNLSGLPIWVRWLGMTFIIHRLSNWLHVVYEYVKKGRILTLDVTHRQDVGNSQQLDKEPLDREEQSE